MNPFRFIILPAGLALILGAGPLDGALRLPEARAASPEQGSGPPGGQAPSGGAAQRPAGRAALRLTRNIMTIRLEKGSYQVMELLDFENPGKAPIVSKDGAPTIRIALPASSNVRNPEVEILSAPHGLDRKFLQLIGKEIISTETIPPGRKLVVLLYRMADEFGGITVGKPILYGTDNFAIYPEKGGVQLSAGSLNRLEPVKMQDREFDRFAGATRPGAKVRFHIQAPDSLANPTQFFAALGGLFMAGAAVTLWVRGRRRQKLARGIEREELVAAVAALDDRLALGEITPEDHRAERTGRLARLRELSG